jgi:AP2 domain/HNH endonuclease
VLTFIKPDIVQIPLSQGKLAEIDAADLPLVESHSWHAVCSRGKWYAVTNVHTERGRRLLRMHTLLIGRLGCDHKDGNGLNNRRSNLRIATQSQNAKNRSKRRRLASSTYKGVHWHKRVQKWTATIGVNYKTMHLGYFDDAESAARAYDAAAKLHNGPFANVNFQTSGGKLKEHG